MHGNPGVGDDQVRALNRLERVAFDGDNAAGLAGETHELVLGVELRGAGEGEVEPELRGGMQERAADIVAIARPDDLACL